ncbi:MAG: hypothetical protein AAF645_11735, partial [Myxococcota bacterium]
MTHPSVSDARHWVGWASCVVALSACGYLSIDVVADGGANEAGTEVGTDDGTEGDGARDADAPTADEAIDASDARTGDAETDTPPDSADGGDGALDADAAL